MRSSASTAAQLRFHRYVATLFATTVPIVAIVELIRSEDEPVVVVARVLGSALITVWAIVVARSKRPDAVSLVLGTMGYTGSFTLVEAWHSVDMTTFDYATTYGLLLLMAVLAGSLVVGRRPAYASGLALSVAGWVIAVGVLSNTPVDAVVMQAVIAVIGVLITTALVAELFDQLFEAISAHEQGRRLQEAIARCSEALLVHPDSFALYEAVKAVFDASDSDYAFIDRVMDVDGEPGWTVVAHASKPEEHPGVGWESGAYSQIPSTYDAFLHGRESLVRVDEMKGAERNALRKLGISSGAAVPIYVGSELRGSIGFVEHKVLRKWTEAELQTLWRAADMIGSYWHRQDDAEALREINESKDKLLASVSHEIRTPLTAIVGLSEQIVSSNSYLNEGEFEELSSIIAIQSRELAELVEDLLVASRADFGNLSISPEPVDLAAQVARVLEGVGQSMPPSKTISWERDDVWAFADPLRVRQIIRNLVTNAIKYGGNDVTIALVEDDEAVRVVVSDDGSGVTAQEESLIFERYYRSTESPTQPGSVGIGLAVSRQLAEMMDGSLSYVRGSDRHRFELLLPISDRLVELHQEDLATV